MQAGKKMHEQIDEAIRRYERLLLILSPNSMNSEWVKTEISKARKRERTGKRRVLFPFGWSRLMPYEIGSVLTQTPGKTRPRKSGNTSYQTSATGRITTRTKRRFSNLLRDLKTGQTKAAET